MELEVDPRKLAELASNLDAAARAIDDELRAFSQASTRLTNAWQGAAQGAYQGLYARYHAGSQVQVRTLRAASASLQELAREYLATDMSGAKRVPGGIIS